MYLLGSTRYGARGESMTQDTTKGRPDEPNGPSSGTNLMEPVERVFDEDLSTSDNTQGVIDA
jgi:hypothetical protein